MTTPINQNPPSNASRIAVLMPVYNRLEYTGKALEHLFGSLHNAETHSFQTEVVLIDDGSSDGTAQWVAQHYPSVRLLKGDGNLWWSGAVSLGARHALEHLQSDWIVLWNNDIRPAEDYFANLFRLLENLSEKTILGSKVYLCHRPDVIFSMGSVFDARAGRHAGIGSGEKDSERFNLVCAADWAPGMGTVIPRKVFETIGFWDKEHFPQYHGDSDFCLRAKKAGFNLRVHPCLRLWNDKSSSGLRHHGNFRVFLRTFRDRRSNYHLRTQFFFYRRHAKSPLAWTGFLKMYAAYIGGFFKWKILGCFGIRRRKTAPKPTP